MAAADRQRADEALDWVRRIHDPSFADWEGHAAWLEADPRNLAAFDEAAFTIEAASRDLAPVKAFVTPPAPVNDNPAHGPTHSIAIGRSWRRWGVGLGVAVAAAIVVVGPALMHDHAQSYLVQTRTGEQRTVTLDETRIVLNGGSRLRLDHADTRTATLEAGEAWFAVRHDAAHPFVVQAGNATFQDIGTIFDVVERRGSTQVSVREGAVLYDPKGRAVRLDGGQSIRIVDKTATVQPVDIAAVGGWRTGRLLYQDAPVTDVAGDIARNIGEPITVDPAIAQRRFSGVVQIDADRSRMFKRVAAVMGVTIRRGQQGWQMVMPDR